MRFFRGLSGAIALTVLTVVAGACATTGIRPQAISLPTRQYTFPSGLRVVIEEDASARSMEAVWIVEAGFADDPPDQPGLAHAVEHIVFEIPEADGDSARHHLLDRGAVTANAETDLERTTFWVSGPCRQLDSLVATQVGWMANPLGQVDDAALEALLNREGRVIDEEIRWREDGAGFAGRLLAVRLFPADHPLGRVGRAGFKSATTFSSANIRAFAREHYRPEKMTLAVSGAIPPGWDAHLRSMIAAAMGPAVTVPHLPERRVPRTDVPPPAAGPEIEVKETNVAHAELRMGWRLPGASGLGAVPLQFLGRLVGAALEQTLSSGELANVVSLDASVETNASGSVLTCVLVLRDRAWAESTRTQVLDIVGQQLFLRHPWFRDARRGFLKALGLELVFQCDSLGSRTETRALLAHAGEESGLGGVFDAIGAVSFEALSDLTTRYLTSAGSRSLLLVPNGDRPIATSSRADHRSSSNGVDDRGAVANAQSAARAQLDHPLPPHSREEIRAVMGRPWASAAKSTKLANGLTVVALRRLGLPFTSVLLGYRSLPDAEAPSGVEAAARFARRYRGLASVSALDDDMLVQKVAQADNEQIEISAYASNIGRAISYLNEVARRTYVEWPNEAFRQWAGPAAVRESQPDFVASRSLAEALWAGHAYGRQVLVARMRELTHEEVAQWVARVDRPENGALVVVGDVDPDETLRIAANELEGAWKTQAVATPPSPPAVVRNAGRDTGALPVLFTEDRERRATRIELACLLPPARRPRDHLVNALFARVVQDELFQRLRERLGDSYSVQADWTPLWGGSASLSATLDIERGKAGQGIQVLQEILTDRSTPFFDSATVERARWRLAVEMSDPAATNREAARALFHAWKDGWQPSTLDEYPDLLSRVEAGELDETYRACRGSAVVSVVGPVP